MARDTRAEYAARNARARAAGYSSYRAMRTAREQGREPGGRRQIVTSPAGRVVQTTPSGRGMHVLASQIRNARPDARVKFIVQTADGRTVTIGQKGGMSARSIASALADGIDLGDYIESALDAMYAATGGIGAAVHVQAVIF